MLLLGEATAPESTTWRGPRTSSAGSGNGVAASLTAPTGNDSELYEVTGRLTASEVEVFSGDLLRRRGRLSLISRNFPLSRRRIVVGC